MRNSTHKTKKRKRQATNKSMLENIPACITEEENEALLREINEEEIFQAIWSLGQDKAPGLDGFSIHFFKSFWETIKYDLKRMLN
jgi:hypothetical protein